MVWKIYKKHKSESFNYQILLIVKHWHYQNVQNTAVQNQDLFKIKKQKHYYVV